MFMYQFQGFSQELMMLVGSLMKFKLRVPSIFRKTLYTMTAATVNDIFDKNDFTDPSVVKSVMAVRKYDARLGFSRKWISDFIFQVVMLAKRRSANPRTRPRRSRRRPKGSKLPNLSVIETKGSKYLLE